MGKGFITHVVYKNKTFTKNLKKLVKEYGKPIWVSFDMVKQYWEGSELAIKPESH